ncbi:MAG: helix-turn-helix domain-containing protein [Betaproteobacteria bacterium]|nr:helix-turn-helix domain-containing protein [Betaproteobacteria bacterium]
MGKRLKNYRLVKIHRNYTVEDVGRLLSVHKNTLRGWIKQGLLIIDDKRPKLILGRDLSAFLQARRVKNKRPCKPNQMYCLIGQLKKITKPGRYPVAENLGGTNRLMRFFASSCESLASRMLLDCTFGSAARRLSCDTTKQHT